MRTPLRRLGAVAVTTTALALGGALGSPAADAAPNSYASPAATWLTGQLTGGLVAQRPVRLRRHRPEPRRVLRAAAARHRRHRAVLDPRRDRAAGGGVRRRTAPSATPGPPASWPPPSSSAGRNPAQLRRPGPRHPAAGPGPLDGRRPAGPRRRPEHLRRLLQHHRAGLGGARAGRGGQHQEGARASAFLLKQQCAAGFFRVTLEPTTGSSAFTCDARGVRTTRRPSIDATALAVAGARRRPRRPAITGLDDDIDDAADWLVAHQAADGSFVDQGTANTNSTGLAATRARRRSGAPAPPATPPAGWPARQVTAAVADSTAARRRAGRVALRHRRARRPASRTASPPSSATSGAAPAAQAAPRSELPAPGHHAERSRPRRATVHGGTASTTTTQRPRAGRALLARPSGSSPAVTGTASDAGAATAPVHAAEAATAATP